MMPFIIRDFAITRPRHETAQADLLAWLAAAHARSEATIHGLSDEAARAFEARLNKVMGRVACGPAKISRRGSVVSDADSTRWAAKTLYDVDQNPRGKPMSARSEIFSSVVDAYFEDAYRDETVAPRELIHVTCTGYISPSGAQKLVSKRRWDTRVTHAYHMGCYAAFPALRLAAGALSLPRAIAGTSERVDIVHTELCSLHLDPSQHALEQLVVQSLFADGLIRYSMASDGCGLELLALDEHILPGSSESMSWRVTEFGMQMTLSRDVPDQIAGALRPFVLGLFRRAGVDPARELGRTVFAVHPGGPKIIDRVGEVLELSASQLAASREVLFDFGNMSSATLPHVWARLCADPTVSDGTLVASLAFGPGLTVCGALFRMKR